MLKSPAPTPGMRRTQYPARAEAGRVHLHVRISAHEDGSRVTAGQGGTAEHEDGGLAAPPGHSPRWSLCGHQIALWCECQLSGQRARRGAAPADVRSLWTVPLALAALRDWHAAREQDR